MAKELETRSHEQPEDSTVNGSKEALLREHAYALISGLRLRAVNTRVEIEHKSMSKKIDKDACDVAYVPIADESFTKLIMGDPVPFWNDVNNRFSLAFVFGPAANTAKKAIALIDSNDLEQAPFYELPAYKDRMKLHVKLHDVEHKWSQLLLGKLDDPTGKKQRAHDAEVLRLRTDILELDWSSKAGKVTSWYKLEKLIKTHSARADEWLNDLINGSGGSTHRLPMYQLFTELFVALSRFSRKVGSHRKSHKTPWRQYIAHALTSFSRAAIADAEHVFRLPNHRVREFMPEWTALSSSKLTERKWCEKTKAVITVDCEDQTGWQGSYSDVEIIKNLAVYNAPSSTEDFPVLKTDARLYIAKDISAHFRQHIEASTGIRLSIVPFATPDDDIGYRVSMATQNVDLFLDRIKRIELVHKEELWKPVLTQADDEEALNASIDSFSLQAILDAAPNQCGEIIDVLTTLTDQRDLDYTVARLLSFYRHLTNDAAIARRSNWPFRQRYFASLPSSALGTKAADVRQRILKDSFDAKVDDMAYRRSLGKNYAIRPNRQRGDRVPSLVHKVAKVEVRTGDKREYNPALHIPLYQQRPGLVLNGPAVNRWCWQTPRNWNQVSSSAAIAPGVDLWSDRKTRDTLISRRVDSWVPVIQERVRQAVKLNAMLFWSMDEQFGKIAQYPAVNARNVMKLLKIELLEFAVTSAPRGDNSSWHMKSGRAKTYAVFRNDNQDIKVRSTLGEKRIQDGMKRGNFMSLIETNKEVWARVSGGQLSLSEGYDNDDLYAMYHFIGKESTYANTDAITCVINRVVERLMFLQDRVNASQQKVSHKVTMRTTADGDREMILSRTYSRRLTMKQLMAQEPEGKFNIPIFSVTKRNWSEEMKNNTNIVAGVINRKKVMET